MQDPFVVGQAIGLSVAFAAAVFFVARKLCGPAGAGELARLQRISGVDFAEPPESRLSLLVRDWLPLVAGVLAAFVGFCFGFVNASAGRRTHDPGEQLAGVGVADLPKLRAGYIRGCERKCASSGTEASTCSALCACSLSALRSRHSDDAAFAAWFEDARNDLDRVEREVVAAYEECVGTPGGATTAVPPAPAPAFASAPGADSQQLVAPKQRDRSD